MKTCISCKKEKPLIYFPTRKSMLDGRRNTCRDCANKNKRDSREKNPVPYRESERLYRKTDSAKKSVIRATKRWKENHPEQYEAYKKLSVATRNGSLVRMPCEVCSEKKSEAHHDDYEKPLEVRWLCKKHHAEHHKQERESKRGEP